MENKYKGFLWNGNNTQKFCQSKRTCLIVTCDSNYYYNCHVMVAFYQNIEPLQTNRLLYYQRGQGEFTNIFFFLSTITTKFIVAKLHLIASPK